MGARTDRPRQYSRDYRGSSSALERLTRLCAVERLDLRFLIAAQNPRIFRWIEIQTHDVCEFLDEV